MLLKTFYSSITTLFLLLFYFPHRSSATPLRRLLHHPFFPLPPSPSLSPSSLPSTSSPPSSTISDFSGDTNTNTNNYPFFPTYPTTPPPPPPPSPPSTTALPTFPANISSLALPSTSSPPSHSPLSSKLIITLVLLSLFTLCLIISLSLLLHRRRHNHHPYSPSQKPLSPNPPPPLTTTATNNNLHNLSHTSTDFLYVTNSLTNSRDFQPTTSSSTTIEPPPPEYYLKICGDDSPELRPLPPLPRTTTSSQQQLHVNFHHNTQFKDDEDFYSPTSLNHDDDTFGLNVSPTRSYSDFPASDSDVSIEIQTLAARTHHFPSGGRVAPPAPPPPPPQGMGPPPLMPPSGPVAFKSSGNLGEKRKSGERKEESSSNIVSVKPKLKALHWDKVRATSDRVMVWDHLQPGSFQ